VFVKKTQVNMTLKQISIIITIRGNMPMEMLVWLIRN